MSDPSQPPRPSNPGLTSGDPLGGAPTPSPPAFPGGYTSPPPPGAGGLPPAPGSYGYAPGSLRLASWGRRVAAALIDGLLVGIVAIVLLVPLGVGVASTDSDSGVWALVGATVLTTLVFVLVAMLYAPLMMSRTNGQTIGRMAVGIRVIRAGGERMTFGFAALREVAVKGLLIGVVGQVTLGILPLVDVLWPLWDEENRALHDFVVNTRTVRT